MDLISNESRWELVTIDHSSTSLERMPASRGQTGYLGIAPFIVAYYHSTRASLDHCRWTKLSVSGHGMVISTFSLITTCLFLVSRLDLYITPAVALPNQSRHWNTRFADTHRSVHHAEAPFLVRDFKTLQSGYDESGDAPLVSVDLCWSKTGNSGVECHPQRCCETIRRRILVHSTELPHRVLHHAADGWSDNQWTDSTDGQSQTSKRTSTRRPCSSRNTVYSFRKKWCASFD